MGILNSTRAHYKPFDYVWCFQLFELATKMHWIPGEVNLEPDTNQWKQAGKMSDAEKFILTQTQLYLANADTDVASIYIKKYLPKLCGLPEVAQMLVTFAAAEAVHQASYSATFDALALPEKQYGAFMEIPEMYEKHLFLVNERTEDMSDIQKMLLDIAIGSAFGEGVQLFSAFAILLSFTRRGLMNGLGTLTKYIAKDEDLHCEGMCAIFRQIVQEHPEEMTEQLAQEISLAAIKSVDLEDHFIDLVFSLGDLPGMTADNVKHYIRYLTNKRLKAIDSPPGWPGVVTNPFPWIDEQISIPELANFFEVRSTDYGKDNTTGTWESAWQLQETKQRV